MHDADRQRAGQRAEKQSTKLYGWLPYADPPKRSARDNLLQVLFAIGASLRTDLDGVLRIENLWDGLSGSIGKQKIYTGASASYKSPVSSVSVTEHQYAEGGEEAKLFEGATQAGDIITFSEPMYALTASGFSILESNANYAKVSAGNGVLTGRKYLHNTRQVTRSVDGARSDDANNVRTVTDATLVSLVNSVAVAQQLANYYRCSETIAADIVLDRQAPGDDVSVYHPYEKKAVSACIQSLDINVSGTLKAQMKALVGFVPMQIENAEYFYYQETLTEDGTWICPPGVATVTVVCIGAGGGGSSGYPGNASEEPQELKEDVYIGWNIGFGAEGGQGGEPGSGGKIVQATIMVTPLERFQVHIGVGGVGGDVSTEGSNPGETGGETSFGTLSSAQGQASDAGYTDIITGITYALPGQHAGIAGGKGAGRSRSVSYEYAPGTALTDYDGVVWEPGAPATFDDLVLLDVGAAGISHYAAQAGKGSGGGPAVGANGGEGEMGDVSGRTYSEAYAFGGRSGNGADPIKAKDAATRGCGGDGGHGGGGEGGYGLAVVTEMAQRPKSQCIVRRGRPGYGGKAGNGADGVVLLYYSAPKPRRFGAFITQDGKFYLDGLGRFFVG